MIKIQQPKLEEKIIVNSLIALNSKKDEFNYLMDIYENALEKIYNKLNEIRIKLSAIYGYDSINNISKRIKSPDSIINKMQKRNYELNYKSLIENINDIAGIRVICENKNNIYAIVDIIRKISDIKIVEEKDYIKKTKKSGYSGYHLIVETPVEIKSKEILVKVEIQIRTMAMDFWATNEHKIKYKRNKPISILDSKKLVVYAKILNFLDKRMAKLYLKNKGIL